MPNWQPNWQDVRWDWAAADQAAAALDRAAEDIDRTSTARANASERAAADWRGPFRRLFDADLQDTFGSAWELARSYRDAANRIRQASIRARDEQNARQRARQRWWAEYEKENPAAAARLRRLMSA